MVGYGGSSAGSYLADPTSPIPSHCASIVATSTVRVKISHQLSAVHLTPHTPTTASPSILPTTACAIFVPLSKQVRSSLSSIATVTDMSVSQAKSRDVSMVSSQRKRGGKVQVTSMNSWSPPSVTVMSPVIIYKHEDCNECLVSFIGTKNCLKN